MARKCASFPMKMLFLTLLDMASQVLYFWAQNSSPIDTYQPLNSGTIQYCSAIPITVVTISGKQDFKCLVLFSITGGHLNNPITYHKWPANHKVCLFFYSKHYLWTSLRWLGWPVHHNLFNHPISFIPALNIPLRDSYQQDTFSCHVKGFVMGFFL